MAKATVTVTGGKKLDIALAALEDKIMRAGVLRVGFLEGSKYTDTHPIRGTKREALPVAQVAFWNEFGTIRAPARPFFRNTIKTQSKTWGEKLKKAAVFYKYDGAKILAAMGEAIKDDIVSAIVAWPPDNAPRTVEIKGFNKGLIDDGTMQRAVDYEIVTK